MFKQFITLIIIFFILLNFGCGEKKEPPAPDIVATFAGGKITRKEVEDYLNKIVKIIGPTDAKKIHRKDVYKDVARSLALDAMIKQKIREKKLDKRENIKHVMKHISEEMNINELHSRAHQGKIKVSETDIGRYFENNRNQFKDSSLIENKEEIRSILQSKKEKTYFRNYLEELKKNAVITREYRLLKVPEPNETDLSMDYEDQIRATGSVKRPSLVEKKKLEAALRNELEKKWFQENRNRTLFTVHGKRYTVGDFYQELGELPLHERKKYQSFKALKELMDRMIERLLVLEDTYDQMLNTKNQEEVKHIREDMLKQILHQEEVDDKLEISDEEMKSYYTKYKEKFVAPSQAKISYIRVGGGQTDDEVKRAEKKVNEAYKKLKPGFLKNGEPFEKVARDYSEDPETAKNGGKLDKWISESGDMFVEMASHTFHENTLGLSAGKISSPFYFHGSYYIVKMRERKESRPLSFKETTEQIKTELTAIKHEELMRKMGQTLLEKANLVVYDKVIDSMLKEKT